MVAVFLNIFAEVVDEGETGGRERCPSRVQVCGFLWARRRFV